MTERVSKTRTPTMPVYVMEKMGEVQLGKGEDSASLEAWRIIDQRLGQDGEGGTFSLELPHGPKVVAQIDLEFRGA